MVRSRLPQIASLPTPTEILHDLRFVDVAGADALLGVFVPTPLYVPIQLAFDQLPRQPRTPGELANILNDAQGNEPAYRFSSTGDLHNYLYRSGLLTGWVDSNLIGRGREYVPSARAHAHADQLGVIALAELASEGPLYHLLGRNGRPYSERPLSQGQRRLLAALHLLAKGSLSHSEILRVTNTVDTGGNKFILDYPLSWGAIIPNESRAGKVSYELATEWKEPLRILAGGLQLVATDPDFSEKARQIGQEIAGDQLLFRALVQKAAEHRVSRIEGLPEWTRQLLRSAVPRSEYSAALARVASLWKAQFIVENDISQPDMVNCTASEFDAVVDHDFYHQRSGKFMSFAPELRQSLSEHELALLAGPPLLQPYLLFGQAMSYAEIFRHLHRTVQAKGTPQEIEASTFRKALTIMYQSDRVPRNLQT